MRGAHLNQSRATRCAAYRLFPRQSAVGWIVLLVCVGTCSRPSRRASGGPYDVPRAATGGLGAGGSGGERLVGCSGSHAQRSVTASPTTAAGRTTALSSSTTTAERSTASSAAGAGDWPTYHGQPARTGVAATGPALGHVRRLWTATVDGAVYAEPLVARGKVIVATENDSVYALDAATGQQLWRAQLGTPVSGGDLPCGNIDPSGITGTPVIDPAAGVLFAVTFQRFEHRLEALDLASGHVRWQRPIDPPGADPRPISSVPRWRSRTRACMSLTAGCTATAATTTAGCSARLPEPRPDRSRATNPSRPHVRVRSGPRQARRSTPTAICTSPPATAARRRALTSATR